MYFKSNPDQSRGYSNKILVALISFIGFVSTVIGLIQFFNVEPLPVIEGTFCLTNNDHTNKGRIIELIRKIARNSNNIVYFKTVSVMNYCFEDKLTSTNDQGGFIYDYSKAKINNNLAYFNSNSFQLNFDEFLKNNSTDYDELAKKLFSEYNISFQNNDVQLFSKMWAFHMSGYHVFVTVDFVDQNRNQYSDFKIGDMDDYYFIDGPFQIKDTSTYENTEYTLSPPILDSSTKQQVECTKRNWGSLKRFLFCPFL